MSLLRVLLGSLAIAALSLFVVSCGDSDNGEEGATTSESATTTASTTSTSTETTESTTTTASTATTAESTTTTQVTTCSAAGLTPPGSQADLPTPVADRRAAILTAALACDIDGLVAQTAPGFTASFGGGEPAEIWSEGEAAGDGPLRFMVEVLRTDFAVRETEDEGKFYVWPAAFAYESWDDVPEADREALLAFYDEDDLADFESFGGYIGYRVGIHETGAWRSFVAGD